MGHIPQGWSVTWRDHSGPTWPFSGSRSSDESYTQPDPLLLKSECDIRFQFYAPQVTDRAVLFVDFFINKSGQKFLSAVWAHQASVEMLWSAGKNLFLATPALHASVASRVSWFANGLPKPKAGTCPFDELDSLAPPLEIERYVGIQFQNEQCGVLEFEAQIGRTDGGENLVSLIWSYEPSEEVLRKVVNTIFETAPSALQPYTPETIFDLLNFVAGWIS